MHIGQAVVPALVLERETCVIDAECVENRGVQIVHMDAIGGDVVRKVVGFAIADAWLDTAASEPDGITARVMIAAVVRRGELALQ